MGGPLRGGWDGQSRHFAPTWPQAGAGWKWGRDHPPVGAPLNGPPWGVVGRGRQQCMNNASGTRIPPIPACLTRIVRRPKIQPTPNLRPSPRRNIGSRTYRDLSTYLAHRPSLSPKTSTTPKEISRNRGVAMSWRRGTAARDQSHGVAPDNPRQPEPLNLETIDPPGTSGKP